MAKMEGKPITGTTLLRGIPQAWLLACIVAGLAAKLVWTTVWVKDTVVERSEYQAEMAGLRKYVDMKAEENRAYTDKALERFAEKVVNHSDHNHDDMEVKWSRVSATVDAIKEQSITTQKMVIQLLMARKR